MIKINLTLAVIILFMIALASCHRGKQVSVVNDTNGVKASIEYYGKIAFAEDGLSIKSMAPDSYIEFNNNGEKLVAERGPEDGNIFYQLSNGTKTNELSQDNKQLIAEVLKKTIKQANR